MPTRTKRVFVNCPLDAEYREVFNAVIFAVLHCGFFPCSAAEAAGSARQRFERILTLIRTSPLAIHDLSRVELSGKRKLPRFNMPFELGLFVGAREFGNRNQQGKDCMVFEKRKGDCAFCCSDLGGVDPVAHGDNPHSAVRHIRNWLNGHSLGGVSGPRAIDRDYRSFQTDLPSLLASWKLRLAEMTVLDFRKAALEWLKAR
jgi:hypothetical protein